MNGSPISSIEELVSSMEPELDPDEFVYCTFPPGTADGLQIDALCSFHEAEGETMILRRAEAERRRLVFAFPCRKITLRVHSSLEAVGFLPILAGELAKHGISANCISAYYHDHLFVRASDGERALSILRELQRRSTTLPGSEHAR
jgi:hypothetical protein